MCHEGTRNFEELQKKKFKKQTRSDAQRKEIVKKQNKTKHSSDEIR